MVITRARIVKLSMLIVWSVLLLCLLLSARFSWFGRSRTVNIFIWPQMIDVSVLNEFQEKTGITVNVSYYESNEELLVKLRTTKGQGYDVVMPSDYAVEQLCNEGLCAPLDLSKLRFVPYLNPALMHKYFDRHNAYSVPYSASIYGVAVNKKYFDHNTLKRITWSTVFDAEQGVYHIVMPNDARELIFLASRYLFGRISGPVKSDHLSKIIALLKGQKSRVVAYTDFQADYYLASGNCRAAVTSSVYAWDAIRKNPDVEFRVPAEGSFLTIENIALSCGMQDPEAAYMLLNYLYEPAVLRKSMARFSIFPARKDVLRVTQSNEDEAILSLSSNTINKASFFKSSVFSADQINKVWIALKA